ncbi:MAG: acyltransferase [Acidobacteriota bacterium]
MKNARFSVHLDALRGGAALAVVLYHIRFRFFLDYGDVTAPSWFARVFYAATAFGHDAVMVFFVLSGYLIAGSVFKDLTQKRWSWGRYLLHRCARLYVVLLPGLVLTLAWDLAGLHWFGQSSSYTGARLPWFTDYFAVRTHLTTAAFWGNLVFLQRVLVPTFGSNVPLWSLAFEVAYYILFPLVLLAVWPSTPLWQRVVCAALVLAFGALYWGEILIYAPIWLLGFLVFLLPDVRLPAVRPAWGWSVFLPVALVLSVAISHSGTVQGLLGRSLVATDYITGVTTTLVLWLLRGDPAGPPSTRWRTYAGAVAGFSYTLYIVHFPVLVFLRAAFDTGRPWDVTPSTVLATLALAGVSVGYAALVWRLSEAHTTAFREYVRASLAGVGLRIA